MSGQLMDLSAPLCRDCKARLSRIIKNEKREIWYQHPWKMTEGAAQGCMICQEALRKVEEWADLYREGGVSDRYWKQTRLFWPCLAQAGKVWINGVFQPIKKARWLLGYAARRLLTRDRTSPAGMPLGMEFMVVPRPWLRPRTHLSTSDTFDPHEDPRSLAAYSIRFTWLTFRWDLFVLVEDSLESDKASPACMSSVGGSTEEALPACRLWLSECLSSHSECSINEPSSQSSFRPQRLVLIDESSDDGQIRWSVLLDTRETTAAYLTLSHCWGGSTHLKLTRGNQLELSQPQLFEDLPRTFRDALVITLRLGYSLIWIDSICIIQDDIDDWKQQSAVMGAIYSHGQCNIAATWGKDGDSGCFIDRDVSRLCNVFVAENRRFRLFNGKVLREIGLDPLNRRAWAVQERCLAPRQLNFGRHEVFWECQKTARCESGPAYLPMECFTPESGYHSLYIKPSIYVHGQSKMRQAWREIIRWYGTCEISKPEDLLPALAGLAAKYRETTGDRYLAGLWRQELPWNLLWRSSPSAPQPPITHSSHPQCAPSWSWGSVTGQFSQRLFGLRELVPMVRIHDVQVKSDHPSALLAFTSGYMIVEGMVVTVEQSLERQRYQPIADLQFMLDYEIEVDGKIVVIRWDRRKESKQPRVSTGVEVCPDQRQPISGSAEEPATTFEFLQTLKLLPIVMDTSYYRWRTLGLVLQAVDDSQSPKMDGKTYKRVGQFDTFMGYDRRESSTRELNSWATLAEVAYQIHEKYQDEESSTADLAALVDGILKDHLPGDTIKII